MNLNLVGKSKMQFKNTYEDKKRADAYSKLEFHGTYYLAYRDLPKIISEHVKGRKAIDFGCGTGRSTRFLQTLGFEVIGIDIAEDMIKKAQEIDPNGKYMLVEDGSYSQFQVNTFDLILSVFTFDNIPTFEKKTQISQGLKELLKDDGKIISLVSSPEIYMHEWVSFSTKNFPENQRATSGEKVKIIITDIDDQRPVEDILWTNQAYEEVYKNISLEIEKVYTPLAKDTEPYKWINETTIPPWVIYILKKLKKKKKREPEFPASSKIQF